MSVCVYMCVHLCLCYCWYIYTCISQQHISKIKINIKKNTLLFEERSGKWTKKHKKHTQSWGRENTFLSLVTTTVLSRHSWKISKDFFRFLEILRYTPKIRAIILHNAQNKGICLWIFLSILILRVTRKTPVQNSVRHDGKQLSKIDEHT